MPKLEIPGQDKDSFSATSWGKVVAATPIVMTVIATALAGISSIEMNWAQYQRSWAAQLQSKASDEWNYFQAMRMRSIVLGSTLKLLRASADFRLAEPSEIEPSLRAQSPAPVSGAGKRALAEARSLLDSPAGRRSMASLVNAAFPAPDRHSGFDPRLQNAMQALENGRPEPEISAALARTDAETVNQGLVQAERRLQDFDNAVKPVSQWADRLDEALQEAGAKSERDFEALSLRYDGRRYEAESRLDQTIGYLYELQIRQSNFLAEHHRVRSVLFFYGMLIAEMAVLFASFAMAARRRSLLWTFAAGAGIATVVFSLYVLRFV